MREIAILRGGPKNGQRVDTAQGSQYLTFMRLRRKKGKTSIERLTYRRAFGAEGLAPVFVYMVEKRG